MPMYYPGLKGIFIGNGIVTLSVLFLMRWTQKISEQKNNSFDYLSRFGEVKEYNKGKSNRYFGVKLEGDAKLTRLKSPFIFAAVYI
ncbi:Uncharacterised protein [Escherichia coli]|uniref:Uncharacterized protein n=1 Tax=Escherichia coli TaxID=562 RepID=A0A376YIS6_ECOLX|nr:Uncharacterised protein [Escherichia coli]